MPTLREVFLGMLAAVLVAGAGVLALLPAADGLWSQAQSIGAVVELGSLGPSTDPPEPIAEATANPTVTPADTAVPPTPTRTALATQTATATPEPASTAQAEPSPTPSSTTATPASPSA